MLEGVASSKGLVLFPILLVSTAAGGGGAAKTQALRGEYGSSGVLPSEDWPDEPPAPILILKSHTASNDIVSSYGLDKLAKLLFVCCVPTIPACLVTFFF